MYNKTRYNCPNINHAASRQHISIDEWRSVDLKLSAKNIHKQMIPLLPSWPWTITVNDTVLFQWSTIVNIQWHVAYCNPLVNTKTVLFALFRSRIIIHNRLLSRKYAHTLAGQTGINTCISSSSERQDLTAVNQKRFYIALATINRRVFQCYIYRLGVIRKLAEQ